LLPGERTDGERSSHLQTQLQLVGLENDMALKVGDVAPDFELPAVAGDRQTTMRSRDYLGRENLVVAFHPLDWTPT
jgi:AhpC/TSA family